MAEWTDDQLDTLTIKRVGPRPASHAEQVKAMIRNGIPKTLAERWTRDELPGIHQAWDLAFQDTRRRLATKPAPAPPPPRPKFDESQNEDPEVIVQWITQLLDQQNLKWRQGYGQINAQCPAHEDRQPSMYLKAGRKGALLGCRAGCTGQAIVDALGITMAELFSGPRR